MTDMQNFALAIEQEIYDSGYHEHLYRTIIKDRQISKMTDLEISILFSTFWYDLPDCNSICRQPFFDLTDLCNTIVRDPNADLDEILKIGVQKITFNKQNGDERTMMATRDISLIRQRIEDDTFTLEPTKPEATSVVVFDTEIDEWRRIRPGSIVDIN